MNYSRIESTIDIPAMRASKVVIIGGAFGLARDLARCGLGAMSLVDYDRIDPSNPARQDLPPEFGRRKVEVVAEEIHRLINPEVDVQTFALDFCTLTSDEIDELVGDADLIVDATDFFPVHARLNQVALRLGKPALWVGMYRGARAGEIIHYVPGLTPACYRCICGSRYEAFHDGNGQITSHGGTIFDLHLVDAIAGQIVLGILTRGAANRMGRLIDQLGDRNLLQVKIDPTYTLGEKDIFANYLGTHPANFSFTTIALPMEREVDCPDCAGMHEAPSTTGDESDAADPASIHHA